MCLGICTLITADRSEQPVMKPGSFKPDKIKAINSEQKRAGNVNYTSVKFEYDGDKMPLLRIDGTFKISEVSQCNGERFIPRTIFI